MTEITVFATDGPQLRSVELFDAEGNDLGQVLGPDGVFTEILVEGPNTDLPIVTVTDGGSGRLLIDPSTPVGVGDAVVSFKFRPTAQAGELPGIPFILHVLAGVAAQGGVGAIVVEEPAAPVAEPKLLKGKE